MDGPIVGIIGMIDPTYLIGIDFDILLKIRL